MLVSSRHTPSSLAEVFILGEETRPMCCLSPQLVYTPSSLHFCLALRILPFFSAARLFCDFQTLASPNAAAVVRLGHRTTRQHLLLRCCSRAFTTCRCRLPLLGSSPPLPREWKCGRANGCAVASLSVLFFLLCAICEICKLNAGILGKKITMI